MAANAFEHRTVCQDLHQFHQVTWVSPDSDSCIDILNLPQKQLANINQIPRSLTLFGCVDNLSEENSPLHDIVLQSAPGSPGSYPIIHAENRDGEPIKISHSISIQFYLEHANIYVSW